MSIGWRVAAGSALLLLAGAAEAAAQAPGGRRLQRAVEVDGVRRTYVVHVPARVDGSRDVPLVVMLHGTSGDGPKFYDISGWVEKADREGFVAAFPSALSYCLGDDDDRNGVIHERELTITTKWAAGTLGTATMPVCTDEQLARFAPARRAQVQSRTVQDDVAFVRTMVTALQQELPIDRRRMYMSGFSNGSQMAGRLAIEMSDTFAAFGMAAGSLVVPGPALRPTSVLVSVGSMDDRALERAGLPELPLDATTGSIAASGAFVAEAVMIDTTACTATAPVVNGKVVAQATCSRSLVGARNEVVAAVIEDATHEYPNGRNHPVVMADLLWSFFLRHPLD